MTRVHSLQKKVEEKDSRRRIVETATELFARYGVDGTSMQMLADHVKLHKSTLFHHFSGKDELISEVMHDELAEIVKVLKPLASPQEPSLKQLIAVVDCIVDHFVERRWSAMLLVRNMLGPYDLDHSDDSGPLTVEVFSILGNWLDSARKAGVIRPIRLRHTIINFLGLILFYPAIAEDDLSQTLLGGDPRSERAINGRKEELRTLILNGLGPKDHSE